MKIPLMAMPATAQLRPSSLSLFILPNAINPKIIDKIEIQKVKREVRATRPRMPIIMFCSDPKAEPEDVKRLIMKYNRGNNANIKLAIANLLFIT